VPVVAFGLNHRSAPLSLLEQVSVPATSVPKLLRDLCDGDGVSGAVVLATCHRLELYLDADRFHDSFHLVRDALAVHTDTGPSLIADHLVPYYEGEAVEHLFSVAAGLDSAVLGEHEILGQVRTAWERSQDEAACSPTLHLLFRRAVEVGKRVRSDTSLARGTASISHAAVELAADVLGPLAGRRVVVLGAGEMGSGIATSAIAAGADPVVVVNRSAGRAEELCDRLGPPARPVAWDTLDAELALADVVVCSTGSSVAVLDADRIEAALAARAGAPLVLVDVAMPRDVDPAARALPSVTVLDLEDLRDHTARGLEERRHALADAETIVTDAVDRYVGERSSRQADPVIAALRQHAEDVRRAEFARYQTRLGHLSPSEREAVEALTRTLLAKLLHAPTVGLRTSGGTPRGGRLADAAVELFGLDPGSSS